MASICLWKQESVGKAQIICIRWDFRVPPLDRARTPSATLCTYLPRLASLCMIAITIAEIAQKYPMPVSSRETNCARIWCWWCCVAFWYAFACWHKSMAMENRRIGFVRIWILNLDKTGINIKGYIKNSSCTFEDLAESLNLASPRVIYDWINGDKLPSIVNLVKLSKMFNVHLEDILFIENVF